MCHGFSLAGLLQVGWKPFFLTLGNKGVATAGSPGGVPLFLPSGFAIDEAWWGHEGFSCWPPHTISVRFPFINFHSSTDNPNPKFRVNQTPFRPCSEKTNARAK